MLPHSQLYIVLIISALEPYLHRDKIPAQAHSAHGKNGRKIGKDRLQRPCVTALRKQTHHVLYVNEVLNNS